MISGLLTSHWVSRRFSRHWNAIDIGFDSVISSLNKKLFIGSSLEHIKMPSPAITHRAADAHKTLDELFAFETDLLESLRDLKDSNVDIELLYDVISQLQPNAGDLENLRTVWAQSAGLFLGEDRYSSEMSTAQNEIVLKSKIFFLANLCVDMLQFLLQYFLQFSFKNDIYLRYWEERELEYKNWYWIETTPWFWGWYLLQKYDMHTPETPLLHPKRAMRAKLKILREMRHRISESIGRLTVQLNTFRKLQTIEETLPTISQALNQCSVVLRIFSIEQTSCIIEERQSPNMEISRETVYAQIGGNIDSFRNVFISVSVQLNSAKKPNWYSTHWMHIGVGTIVLYFATKSIYESRYSILQYVKDTRDAIVRFWKEHLEVPLKNIWEAVRYDKTTLSVADKVSLKQDMESLGRMVADFAKDNNASLSESDLASLMQAAKEGDLAEVMKAYEQNIKSPIRNVVFGDLIRLVLIQVQKQKVDLEKAMEALDQLLRANELNFRMSTPFFSHPTLPSLLCIWYHLLFFFRVLGHNSCCIVTRTSCVSVQTSFPNQNTISCFVCFNTYRHEKSGEDVKY
eukprot:Phypoly_transcript_04118.p1 GENE.Phypoly_transcript_04118~~Phypoly_transcript_04118.p1  ORF type:complete len:572 (+),score=59.90 Phypoly_transcript_04118:161-1876(+)